VWARVPPVHFGINGLLPRIEKSYSRHIEERKEIMSTRRAVLALSFIAVWSASAADSKKSDPVNHDRGGIAIQGYDPVAYFTDSKPVKGDAKFSYTWRGTVWQFASAQHRDLFAETPEKYAPQYGGFCAYAVSENHTADIDPEAWKIIENKLYLNYSKSVQQMWLKEPEARIRRADQNWPNLHK
jgi:YHS domain-containing protein